jgi:hypothetical protein
MYALAAINNIKRLYLVLQIAHVFAFYYFGISLAILAFQRPVHHCMFEFFRYN